MLRHCVLVHISFSSSCGHRDVARLFLEGCGFFAQTIQVWSCSGLSCNVICVLCPCAAACFSCACWLLPPGCALSRATCAFPPRFLRSVLLELGAMATEPIDLDLLPDAPTPGIAATIVPSGAASSAGSAGERSAAPPNSPAQVGPTALCYFECGPRYAISQLTNMGNARCVRWVCNPCNNARKAIECAAKKDAAFRKQISDMRTNNPVEWKAKVRALRIRPDAGSEGVESRFDRRAAVAHFAQSMRQFLCVRDDIPLLWLSRPRFLCHQKNVEGLTDDEAKTRWTQALQDPDVAKRGQGEQAEVAVRGIPQTVGSRGREYNRAVHSGELITSADAEQDAFARMTAVGNNRTLTDQDMLGVGGELFRTGASASSIGPEIPHDQFPSVAVVGGEAPKLRSLLPPPPEGTEQAKPRSLAAVLSDPDSVRAVPSGKRPRKAAGASGVVLQKRQDATAVIKRVHSEYGMNRRNLGVLIRDARSKLLRHGVTDEDVDDEPSVEQYIGLLTEIAAMQPEVTTWTVETYSLGAAALASKVSDLEAMVGQMTSRLEVLQQRLVEARNAAVRGKRAATALMAKAVRPYTNAGVHGHWARLLFKVRFVLPPTDASLSSTETQLAAVLDDSAEVHEEPTDPYEPTFPAQVASSDVDWSLPHWFTADATGVGQPFTKYVSCYGAGKVSRAVELVEQFMTDNRTNRAMVRLKPKVTEKGFEGMVWVPQELAVGTPPESLRTFGAAWLLTGLPGLPRGSPVPQLNYAQPRSSYCRNRELPNPTTIPYPR